MRTTRLCLYLLLAVCSAAGQQSAVVEPPVDEQRTGALRWLSELRGRFDQVRDPVVKTYAKTRLAEIVCSQDRAAGTKQFQEAIGELRQLPEDAFDKSSVVLPADSFSALWDLDAQLAKSCNPDVSWYDEKLDSRKQGEWRKAAIWVSEAPGMVDRNPERAAQLARAAISVSAGKSRQTTLIQGARRAEQGFPVLTPGATLVYLRSPYLNLSSLVRALIKLRVVAPDLSDALFQYSADIVMAFNPPLPMEFGELAAYLYPGGASVQFYDSFLPRLAEKGVACNCELPEMPNLMTAELKGNTDLAAAYFADVVRLLQQPQPEDPDGAYALAFQLLPKARELAMRHAGSRAGEYAGLLESALVVLEAQAGADAAKVRARLGTPPNPRKAEHGTPERDAAALGEANSSFNKGDYDAARATLSDISDASMRTQVSNLVEFTDLAASGPVKIADQALDKEIYPVAGAKRALLYAGLAGQMSSPEGRIRAVSLGLKDAAQLPVAEQVCILPPLAAAAEPVAPDEALAILKKLVKAHNELGGAPQTRSEGAPNIQCRTTGPVELVNAGERRFAFRLGIPGEAAFTLSALLERARASDFSKLVSAVTELGDENRLVGALLALAKLRVVALGPGGRQ
jgi:hypothetical protein